MINFTKKWAKRENNFIQVFSIWWIIFQRNQQVWLDIIQTVKSIAQDLTSSNLAAEIPKLATYWVLPIVELELQNILKHGRKLTYLLLVMQDSCACKLHNLKHHNGAQFSSYRHGHVGKGWQLMHKFQKQLWKVESETN